MGSLVLHHVSVVDGESSSSSRDVVDGESSSSSRA